MEVPILTGAACARCGDSLDTPGSFDTPGSLVAHGSLDAPGNAGLPPLCRPCRLAPPAFERAVAHAFYQDSMRGAIHALKYEQMHPAARRLGHMLAQAIAQLAGDAPADMLVVPIPLHRSRQAERGFNQARLLATHALGALRASHPQWRLTMAPAALMRLRATESQASLVPRERRRNVRGAFSVSNAAAVKGRHILLVDDILTTGATARAASLALKRAGAATVWVATLARARRMHWAPEPAGTHNRDFASSETQGNPAPHPTQPAGHDNKTGVSRKADVDSSIQPGSF